MSHNIKIHDLNSQQKLGVHDMSEQTMTPNKLDDITKKHLSNYMEEIGSEGGVDSEQALYALFNQIVLTLEVQLGKPDAKSICTKFVEQHFKVA